MCCNREHRTSQWSRQGGTEQRGVLPETEVDSSRSAWARSAGPAFDVSVAMLTTCSRPCLLLLPSCSLQGGGLCDVDNLRTLCVACHADVTKQQAKERAAGRKQAGAAGAGGSGQPGWEDVAREGGQPVVKRRKKLQRVVLDADESGGAQGSLAAPAGVDRGKQAVVAAAAAAAAQAAGAADPGTKWRPRKRLKPLFAESEGVDAAAEADGGASAAQPPAAPKAGVASGLESGGSPSQQGHTRQRRRLKPLFACPGEELPGALPAAAAEASGTSPDAAAARSSHRLARSSTAEEPVTVQLGAAGAPLPLQAANGTVVAPGGIAENACPRSALA